jgi:hypothetical protein
MTALWIVLAFWLGGCLGMVIFAGLQVARDAEKKMRYSPLDAPTEINLAAARVPRGDDRTHSQRYSRVRMKLQEQQ